jgi:uncharacterized protein (DUF1697 family)
MERYVAFLRGMNLGNRRIKNDELRSHFEELGFENVATFRASGNVIFESASEEDEEALAARIEAGLAAALGYEVVVFLRDAGEIAAIADRKPFDARPANPKAKLQVSLLRGKPSAKARRQVLALATERDLLAIEARELYWLPSGGILDSELDLKAVEAAVGVDTRRTMGTIEQIAAKHFG